MNKITTAVFTAFFLSLLLLSCGAKDDSELVESEKMTDATQGLTVYTEISGDAQFMKNGVLTGSSVEIFEEMQKRVGDSTEIQVVPWARGYDAVQKNPNTILFSMTRTAEREDMFKWVGPVLRVNWVFVAKKGSGITVNSLEDAKKVRMIGTYRDDVREKFLKDQGFTNLESATDNVTNVRKLLGNRVDLIVGTNLGTRATVRQAGASMNDIEMVYNLRTFDLYIAFSKSTSDAIVNKYRKALEEMINDGSFAQIYNKYYPGEPIPR